MNGFTIPLANLTPGAHHFTATIRDGETIVYIDGQRVEGEQ